MQALLLLQSRDRIRESKSTMSFSHHHHHQGGDGGLPPSKRRRVSDASIPMQENIGRDEWHWLEIGSNSSGSSTSGLDFMSRDDIERCSPSRRDGIDSFSETRLRYSYCLYLRNLGVRLGLPQTTVATAVVFCHRFFLRRSHACHDRFLVATAALFLAAKSEETPRLLYSVLKASCEVSQLAFFPHMLHRDWFQQYRERVIEAEQMILMTLNFELDVKHPYAPLTSVLTKLGLSRTILFVVAWNLVSEGLRSSLWLQFKPHHIAAGAVLLAAKLMNYDIACSNFWHEFQTTPSVLQDVVQQLLELF